MPWPTTLEIHRHCHNKIRLCSKITSTVLITASQVRDKIAALAIKAKKSLTPKLRKCPCTLNARLMSKKWSKWVRHSTILVVCNPSRLCKPRHLEYRAVLQRKIGATTQLWLCKRVCQLRLFLEQPNQRMVAENLAIARSPLNCKTRHFLTEKDTILNKPSGSSRLTPLLRNLGTDTRRIKATVRKSTSALSCQGASNTNTERFKRLSHLVKLAKKRASSSWGNNWLRCTKKCLLRITRQPALLCLRIKCSDANMHSTHKTCCSIITREA